MSKKTKEIVGLDIGSSRVKIISCELKEKLPVIDNFKVFAIDYEKKLDATLLKDFYSKSGVSSHNVNISISGPSVVLRYITLPKIKPAEIKSALKFELEKNIPFSINDVITDGQIINEIKDKVLVLAAAAKKDLVLNKIKLVKDAGLNINAIDIDALAVINAFTYQADSDISNTNLALVNLGGSFTNLSILKKGIPAFNRDISIGGTSLTKKISDVMGISLQEAEKIKIEPGQKAQQVSQICEVAVEDLVSEVKFSFDYFESKENESVNEIYISGGSSKLSLLGNLIDEVLGVPYKIWDPICKFDLDSKIDEKNIKSSSHELAVAAGLIARHI